MTATPALTPLPPGSTLGILGGGQLGRMLSQAASRLGFNVVVLDPEDNSPAGRVSQGQIVAAYDNPTALGVLGQTCAAVTFEFENVPAASVAALAKGGALVAPGPRALAVAQDRVEEKTFLNGVGATTVDFVPVDGLDDLLAGLERLGAPALLKTRREGYDGKGQIWVRSAKMAPDAWHVIGERPAILEARADFVRELSVIAARGRDGVFQCVKDQARRAFHQYARACVRSGRRGKLDAFRCGFELTGSVGMTPEVSG